MSAGVSATTAVLVDGTHPGAWADAFPAAVYAGRGIAPVLLTSGDTVPAASAAYLADGGTPLLCGVTTTATACTAAARALGHEP